MLERLVGHHGPKVRAADADVDDVPNALAGMAQPAAASDAMGEVRHFIQHGVYFRHDVHSVNDDRCSPGSAQSHVKDGAILRDIDLVPAKHGIDSSSKAGFLGQLDEELQRIVRDPILRIIQEKPRSFHRQPLAALRVLCKELTEMHFFDFRMMRLERFPRFTLGEWFNVLAVCNWCGACWHTRAPHASLLRFRSNSTTNRQPANPDILPRSKTR